jgi:hypothetical protein
MVATVAALIAVLITLAPGQRSGPTVGGRTTSTATNNERGRWVDLTALDYKTAFDANREPAIAPTNPSVVYDTQAEAAQLHVAATMRRTDDGGKTWHALPLPVAADHVGFLGVAVSPLDARTVFLDMVDDTAADCPANRTQQNTEAGNGHVSCSLQYTSVDAGEHWTATNLPLADGTQPGVLTAGADAGGAGQLLERSLHAQGNTLYAGFACVGAQWCTRLVSSADGGLTWQFADEQIVPHGGRACDYAVSAGGTTLFALTAAKDCSGNANVELTLWRSDDSGAHWTRVSTLSTPDERNLFLTTDAASGKQLLYTMLPRITSLATDKMGGKYPIFSADPANLKVSADGGKTWQNAPSNGIPADLKLDSNTGILGTLHDGTVVVEFSVTSAQGTRVGTPSAFSPPSTASAVSMPGYFAGGTLFAWKRGDTQWHQIAPPLNQEIGYMLAIAPKDASQQDTLYLVMVNRGYSGPTVDTFRFLRYEP